MSRTDYQAKYFAHELTRRFPPDSVEKLTAALVDAQVDLNPHQIDAALTLEAKLAGQSRSRPWKLSATQSSARWWCSAPPSAPEPTGYPNLTVKKIPKAVLARCEWGHDDYNLRVENLPKAPPRPGQMPMFDEEVEP